MHVLTMKNQLGIEKIISGGQTGVDRGALDAAIACNIPHGGACPKGRLAEDGPIADCYQLTELDSRDYAVRTERNVLDSDGTLILFRQTLTGGTLLTYRLARQWDKPLLRVRLERPIDYASIAQWIMEHKLRILNIAGPRGSSEPGLQQLTERIVATLLKHPGHLPLD
jgi:hypothetical protein